MIVYHGSTVEIQNPDVKHSKNYLDFGRGFYVTEYREQAEKWAQRRAMRNGGYAFVNVYELSIISDCAILRFEEEDEKWIDFVCACRKGGDLYKNYDIISGGVANDNVFKVLDMYFKGIWDKNRVLAELKYYKTNNQICITKQEILDRVLTFRKSYIVGELND